METNKRTSHFYGSLIIISFLTCFIVGMVHVSSQLTLVMALACLVLFAVWTLSREIMLNSHPRGAPYSTIRNDIEPIEKNPIITEEDQFNMGFLYAAIPMVVFPFFFIIYYLFSPN